MLVATHVATPGRAQDALIIATHKEGSAYHKLGVAFAEALTDALDREFMVTPYPRWSEYLPLIDAGEVAMGFVTGLDAGALYKAEDDERLLKLRALMRLWPIRYTFLARANLGINNVVGLRGRHIALDLRRGTALSAVNRAILETVAINERNVRPVVIRSLTDGINRMAKGELDAVPIAVGIPLVRRARESVPGGVVYLSLIGPRANAKFLGELVPGLYTKEVQPQKRLPEITEPILVAAFDVYLLASTNMPSDVASAIVAVLHVRFEDIQKSTRVLRTGDVTLVAAPTNSVPYHPGAISYYRAEGLWTFVNDEAEARLVE